MKSADYRRTKFACYAAYFTMSPVFSLPPLLFVTLRETFGISYTLLGTLVLTNFCTQLLVDLIFTMFSKHFNVPKVLRIMPLITTAGFVVYALVPSLFPQMAYPGLLAGTILFSISAGLSEVLLSPTIAAIPSDNPQRDMSLLHSLYAFGVFTVVAVSTLFLKVFGSERWMILTLLLAAPPVIAAALFMTSPIPDMSGEAGAANSGAGRKKIFGYMENALHIDKAVGDILGMAMFAILLGVVRITYAKYNWNICRVLLIGMVGATACYLVAGLSVSVVPAFIACILTGIFTSMLWPGTLIMMEEKLPGVGVAAYALMASGGDLGASVSPQLLGIVIDKVSVSTLAANLSASSGLSPEQIGLKAGMLVTAVFPIIGTFLVLYIIRYFRGQEGRA